MLTKSDLLSFRQCPRQLWLTRHRPELIPRDHPATWRRANDGRIVGERARAALGPDIWWPAGDPDPATAAAAALRHLRAKPSTSAVEFPAVAGPLYIRAELNLLDGRWRYPGHGDYRGLFRTLDATGEARARTALVPAWADQAAGHLGEGGDRALPRGAGSGGRQG